MLIDDQVLAEAGLQVPHPGLHERAFILAPLADLVPDLVIPSQAQTVKQLLAAADRSGVEPYRG